MVTRWSETPRSRPEEQWPRSPPSSRRASSCCMHGKHIHGNAMVRVGSTVSGLLSLLPHASVLPSSVLLHVNRIRSAPSQVRRRLLHTHNGLLGATYNGLATMLANLQPPRWAAAAAAAGRSVEILEAAYPPNSLVIAHQQQTQASMVQQAGDEDAGDQIYHKMAHVFKLHYGDVMSEASKAVLDAMNSIHM